MPNIKSAKKRVRVTKAKYDCNKARRTEFKTTLKRAKAEGADAAAIAAAVKKIDQSATRGIIHKNKAARLKSQLAKKQMSA